MKVKVKNNMQYGVKKDGIVEVVKELSDAYVGTHTTSDGKTNTVRVKKVNCMPVKQ